MIEYIFSSIGIGGALACVWLLWFLETSSAGGGRGQGGAHPDRPSREAEEAAIARFVAERGVTRAPTADQEVIPSRQELHRPQPMAGWRG